MVVARIPTIVVGGRTLAPAQVVLPVEITVGRENPTAQPNANALSFSYLGNLPPNFVRGALVNATLLGYEEPGWSDIWDDMWSHEPSTPGLLPEPTPEGFSEWQRFWGWESITELDTHWNKAENPCLSVDTRHYGAAPGPSGLTTSSRGTDAALDVGRGRVLNNYHRVTWTTPPTDHTSTGNIYGTPTTDALLVTGGVLNTVTTYVRTNRADRSGIITITWHDAAGTQVGINSGPVKVMAANQWTRLDLVILVPAGTVRGYCRAYCTSAGANWEPGDWWDNTGWMSDPTGEVLPYLDGDTPDTDYFHYEWDGPPGASRSTMTELFYAVTAVAGSYEDGGATLVTDYNSYSGEVFWQGEPFSVSGTDRTVRTNVRLTPEGGGCMARWDLLWSATNPKPDYFGSDVHALSSEPVTVNSGGSAYMGATFTAPDEAQYVRLSIVLDSRFSPTWDNAVGTWDDVDPAVTWDTYTGG